MSIFHWQIPLVARYCQSTCLQGFLLETIFDMFINILYLDFNYPIMFTNYIKTILEKAIYETDENDIVIIKIPGMAGYYTQGGLLKKQELI